MIGVSKAVRGEAIHDPTQEDVVLEKAAAFNRTLPSPVDSECLASLFKEIMACAVDLQNQLIAQWPEKGFGAEATMAADLLNQHRQRISELNQEIIRLVSERSQGSEGVPSQSPPPDPSLWGGYLNRIFARISQ